MKKLIILFLAIALTACSHKQNSNFVTFSGNIKNYNEESLTIYGKKEMKNIYVDKDGNFNDTIKVMDGFHGLTFGNKQFVIYLKNGDDLVVHTDFEKFPASIEFDGKGKGPNNYILKKMEYIKNEDLENSNALFELEQEAFDKKMSALENKLEALILEGENLDETLIDMEREANSKLIEYFTSNYAIQHTSSVQLKVGTPSPKFNYPNTEGKNVSLDDLKGDYVYVDVWATWCGPCKKEIPFLKEIQTEFKDKNISFVSLSIDKVEHKEKWLDMVNDEQLGGIQIMADKDFRSDFITAYNINAIPRFILIDKEGNILNANAPRPSDPRLKEILGTLNL